MTNTCMDSLHAHADIEAAEDASIETMLDLLPRNVGFAVVQIFRYRYSFVQQAHGLTICNVKHKSTTWQPLLLFNMCVCAPEC